MIRSSNIRRFRRAISISANRLFGRMIADDWNIGIVREPIDHFLEQGPSSVPVRSGVHWFPRPRPGSFFADPFGIAVDRRIVVLCEEFDYRICRGRIVSFEVANNNLISGPRPAIELPVHVTYPYLVEHRGEIYCIPETWQAGEIRLYRAIEFPNAWSKVSTLVDRFAGVDPTVFWYEGRWWLACTNHEDQEDRKLFLWHARDLFGPWTAHTANPVKIDVRSSRPAGTPFIHDGQLYRPAQDSSITYGGRVVLNRVTRLTSDGYKEEPTAYIEPSAGPYPHGLHTISSVGDICLVDGKNLALAKRPFVRIRGQSSSVSL